MAEDKDRNLVYVGPGWSGTSKNGGRKYISFKVKREIRLKEGAGLVLFQNDRRTGDNQPSVSLYADKKDIITVDATPAVAEEASVDDPNIAAFME
jgi:outer membrane protein assembly factor BamB